MSQSKSDQDSDPQLTRPSVQGYFVQVDESSVTSQISLFAFWSRIWSRKGLILGLTSLLTVTAIVFVLVVQPVYRSETLLADALSGNAGASLGSLSGQFGGLASIAGLDLGGQQRGDEAIALFTSREFLEAFITRHKLMPILFADDWDADKSAWRKPADDQPSLADAVRKFKKKVLNSKGFHF